MSLTAAVGLCLVASLAAALVLDLLDKRYRARRAIPPCGCGQRHIDPLPRPTDPEGE